MSISFDEIYLTSEQILERVSQKELYEHYSGEKIIEGKLVKCCFHKDSTPSMGFVTLGTNIIYNCFGCGAKGNIFNFVQRLYNCNYGKAHNIIQKQFKLSKNYDNISNNNSNPSIPIMDSTKSRQVLKTQIIPTYRNWNKIDFNYWNRYEIPFSLLDYYNIRPCERVYVVTRNGEYILFAEHTKNNPIYCYHIAGSMKIYRPLNPNKKGKWASNCDSFNIQGLEQLPSKGELLIITSSMKDVLVLNLMGYDAIALGGEGNKIPESILDFLWACFDNIVVFYDNDKAGLEYGITLSEEIGAGNISIPIEIEDKDISDYVDSTSLEEGSRLMKELL